MHLGSLESTQEARVALGYRLVQLLRIFRALQTSEMFLNQIPDNFKLTLKYQHETPLVKEQFFSLFPREDA